MVKVPAGHDGNGCCQTNANTSQFPGIGNLLGCAGVAPLGKSGGAVELEI